MPTDEQVRGKEWDTDEGGRTLARYPIPMFSLPKFGGRSPAGEGGMAGSERGSQMMSEIVSDGSRVETSEQAPA